LEELKKQNCNDLTKYSRIYFQSSATLRLLICLKKQHIFEERTVRLLNCRTVLKEEEWFCNGRRLEVKEGILKNMNMWSH